MSVCYGGTLATYHELRASTVIPSAEKMPLLLPDTRSLCGITLLYAVILLLGDDKADLAYNRQNKARWESQTEAQEERGAESCEKESAAHEIRSQQTDKSWTHGNT